MSVIVRCSEDNMQVCKMQCGQHASAWQEQALSHIQNVICTEAAGLGLHIGGRLHWLQQTGRL